MTESLAGFVVLLTGASSGIGAATARTSCSALVGRIG
jgi:NADP-dependent 3-hydroxy acid dehydrogenase YdfG